PAPARSPRGARMRRRSCHRPAGATRARQRPAAPAGEGGLRWDLAWFWIIVSGYDCMMDLTIIGRSRPDAMPQAPLSTHSKFRLRFPRWEGSNYVCRGVLPSFQLLQEIPAMIQFQVEGMSCNHCVGAITRAVQA